MAQRNTRKVSGNKTVHIGSGAGFAGDRFDAAVAVVDTLLQFDGPRYLIYEVMGERTLAIAQRLKKENPQAGYSPWLDIYLPQVLKKCIRHKIKIVANFGNANPAAAASRTLVLAKELGIDSLRVGVVTGDDLLERMSPEQISHLSTIEGTDVKDRELLAANAYIGARSVAEAIGLGVDIVLVGRTTDAALVLGPLMHEFGWTPDNYRCLAGGTLAGHVLECGGQVTGGYFADPGQKEVPDLHRLGFPIAEVDSNGEFTICKAENTGGIVTKATVTEQMLYEIHNPGEYLTPDVTLDINNVSLHEIGADRIRVTGAQGKAPPDTLKVTLSVDGGWLGESEISYAGVNALARARLAATIVRKRLEHLGVGETCRIEIIGSGVVHDNDQGSLFDPNALSADGEYRLRLAVRSPTKAGVQKPCDEVLALYCCGPAAGGGVRQSVTPQVSTASILMDRGLIEPGVTAREVKT
ncbi:hypothetical protein AB833_16545 [Chromatiales bacterium (ex Bugula neritina AB1)]|nr:hypothetical protein AB833_16545 [Chromatiales bacterium (ex Bugula neritina AB1)]